MNHPFNLFILEDDPMERDLLRLLIGRNFPSWHVHMSATASQLLEALRDTGRPVEKASLLLVDMLLSDSDGMTVMQKVRTLDGFACLPVVGFSNYSSRVDIDAFLGAGATAFFSKPAEIDQMIHWLAILPSFVPMG